jgi:UDPglucose 6-dehydrogenase
MRQANIFDGRNIYDPQSMAELGFTYRGVGRGYPQPEGVNPNGKHGA